MPFYQKQGKVPPKRHTQFRNTEGDLYWEELISRAGFSGIYSNIYHKNPPTSVEKVGEFKPFKIKSDQDIHRHCHIKTEKIELDGNAIKSRYPLFYNSDLIIYKSHISQSMDSLFKNGCADEIIFIHSGIGKFRSNFGNLDLQPGDYLVIPKGTIWKIDIEEEIRALVVESKYPIETPRRYRNNFGQLLEHSPFSERDIRTPKLKELTNDHSCLIDIKLINGIQSYKYKYHPFDLIGWDGFYYPWIFNIHDFMPITGKIHQPPPVHQTFQSKNFVVCSFVPRLFDYHKDSIPAPYAHSNIDSDEIIFYSKGNFMSRKGIEPESITYHPSGIPHGPQPGKIEESLKVSKTNELAVMIDTFKPLNIVESEEDIEDKNYPFSWL